jgi:SAM-dependent methyltransferase
MKTNISAAIESAEPWRCILGGEAEKTWSGYRDGIVAGCEIIADVALRHVDKGGYVLDYGCGPMNKTAVLAWLGYRCTGFDEYVEAWHRPNLTEIKQFAAMNKMELVDGGSDPLPPGPFDMVMMIDVLEHLQDSPRKIMTELVERLGSGGILLVMVPNAGNIRKRLALLFGGTNMPNFGDFYWNPYRFVGHVREYVRGDLRSMAFFLGLELLELRGVDTMIQKVPNLARPFYRACTWPFDGLKDTWLMVCRKPKGWRVPERPERAK